MPTAIAQTSHIKREKEGKRSKERKKNHIETTEIQRKRSKIAQVSGKDTQQVAKTSGNLRFRTPDSRVAGENSTTAPPMLTVRYTQDCEHIFLSIDRHIFVTTLSGFSFQKAQNEVHISD